MGIIEKDACGDVFSSIPMKKEGGTGYSPIPILS
jgi:hypothetical protein